MRNTFQDLERACEDAGLWVTTYSPGDGKTRYKFYTSPAHDYFDNRGIFVAVGMRDAFMFLRGWREHVWFIEEKEASLTK